MLTEFMTYLRLSENNTIAKKLFLQVSRMILGKHVMMFYFFKFYY